MLYLPYLTLLILTCAAYGAHVKHTPCELRDEQIFNKCLEETANQYMAELEEDGRVVPFTVNGEYVRLAKRPFNMVLRYQNSRIYNGTKCQVNLKYDKNTNTILGELYVPYIAIEAPFQANGTFANSVPILGSGIGRFDMWGMNASFVSKMHLNEGGTGTLEMEPITFRINKLEKIKLKTFNVQSPNRSIANAIRLISKYFGHLIFNIDTKSFERNFQEHYAHLTEEVIRTMLKDGVINSL